MIYIVSVVRCKRLAKIGTFWFHRGIADLSLSQELHEEIQLVRVVDVDYIYAAGRMMNLVRAAANQRTKSANMG